VGVVGAPSSGIELVLKQISLPVAQIRVIYKNGPQVSIDDIKYDERKFIDIYRNFGERSTRL
jgi:hypothetical protein